MNKKDDKESLFCSFCGKSQKEVKKLIAGPTVFVCDECVELCMDIIKEDSKNHKSKLKKDTPKPSEIIVKLGFCNSTLLYLRAKNNSCHCLTIPRYSLSKRTILTGIFHWDNTPNSCRVIWNPPSPMNATTLRSGSANCAPIAAGNPNPIVPAPPEESH